MVMVVGGDWLLGQVLVLVWWAVRVWVPGGSVVVWVAVALVVRGMVVRVVPLVRRVMVPVGVSTLQVTVAVRVMS